MKVFLKINKIKCSQFNKSNLWYILGAILSQIIITTIYKNSFNYYLSVYCLIVFFIQLLFYCHIGMEYGGFFVDKTISVANIDKEYKKQQYSFIIYKLLIKILLIINTYPLLCIITSFFDFNYDIFIYDIFLVSWSNVDRIISLMCILFFYIYIIYWEYQIKKSYKIENSELYKIKIEKDKTGLTPWDIEYQNNEKRKEKYLEEQKNKQKIIDDYKERMSLLDKKYNGCDKIIKIEDTKDELKEIRVYSSEKIIIIEGQEYNFSDIISFSVSDNSQTIQDTDIEKGYSYAVTNTKKNGSIGRAVVGGMIMGATGAIVGALSADEKSITNYYNSNDNVKTKTSIKHDYTVNLNIKNIESPVIYIHIGNNERVLQETIGLIKVILEISKN